MTHRFSILIALTGCSLFLGKGPHVPSDFQGTTEITVANAWDHPLCVFALTEGDGTLAENWLGQGAKHQNIAPGARRTFSVKPGTYHIVGGFCDAAGPLAASGTYGAATKTIGGPTLIALGPKHVDPVANAETLAFPKLYYAQNSAGGGGGEAAAEPAGDEPAAAESSTTAASSSSDAAPAPAGPQCLSHGAVCADSQPCCAGMTCASRTKYSDGTFGNGYCQ